MLDAAIEASDFLAGDAVLGLIVDVEGFLFSMVGKVPVGFLESLKSCSMRWTC